jgi:hypothetical protein
MIKKINLLLLNYLPPQIIPLLLPSFVHTSSFPHLYLIVVLLPTMFAFLATSSFCLLITRSSLLDRTFLLLSLLRPHCLLLITRPSFHGRAFLHIPPFIHRAPFVLPPRHSSAPSRPFVIIALTSRAFCSAAARSSASCRSSVPIASSLLHVLYPTAMRSSSRHP